MFMPSAPPRRKTQPPESSELQPNPLWNVVPLLLLLCGSLSVALTQKGVGYAWDEAFYYAPAQDAAQCAAQRRPMPGFLVVSEVDGPQQGFDGHSGAGRWFQACSLCIPKV